MSKIVTTSKIIYKVLTTKATRDLLFTSIGKFFTSAQLYRNKVAASSNGKKLVEIVYVDTLRRHVSPSAITNTVDIMKYTMEWVKSTTGHDSNELRTLIAILELAVVHGKLYYKILTVEQRQLLDSIISMDTPLSFYICRLHVNGVVDYPEFADYVVSAKSADALFAAGLLRGRDHKVLVRIDGWWNR